MGIQKAKATAQNGKKPRGFSAISGLDRGSGPVSVVSWDAVDAAILSDAIAAVTDAGDAMTISLTSDRGAYAVTLYSSGDRKQKYERDGEALEDWLTEVVAAYQ